MLYGSTGAPAEAILPLGLNGAARIRRSRLEHVVQAFDTGDNHRCTMLVHEHSDHTDFSANWYAYAANALILLTSRALEKAEHKRSTRQ